MESQQHEENNNIRSSFLCRQSSTRWIPTTEQIRILKELYYNSGVRSPSAEQIQRISAKLRHYGKIEGKNVFYWFQNHKARERQKKRLTVDIPTTTNNYNMPPGISATCTSPGVYGVGQIGGGSLLMERSYSGYCITKGGGDGSAVESNVGWVGVETAAMPRMYHCTSQAAAREMETLQLFPIHTLEQGEQGGGGGEHKEHEEEDYSTCSHMNNNKDYWVGNSHASLELTLNSSYYPPPGST